MATFAINFGAALLLGVVQGLLTPKPDGPRLNDRSVPKATYGVPIPKVYGTALVPSNMIWGIPRVEQKSGGKGIGGGKGGASYKYFGSFAMLFCLGPVVGISRMWANGRIVMDLRSNPDAPPPTRNDPPSSPSNGDKYTVGTAPTGEWTGQTGLIAEWQTAKWYFYPAATTSLSISNRWKQYWRFYTGSSSQSPDPLIQAKEGAARTPAYRGYCYGVAEGLPLNDDPNGLFDFGSNFPSIKVEVVTKGTVDGSGFISAQEVEIYEIIQDVCERVKIPSNEIDVTALASLGSIFGYTQDGQIAAKQIISDLSSLFFFDIQDGKKLKFLPPNRSLSGSIAAKDLGTRVFGSDHPNTYSLLREDITQLPYEINLVYFDQQKNLLENTVTGRYSQGNNVNVSTVNIPITMTQSKAQSAINRAIQLAWIRRKKYEKLLLPPKYLHLQVGDRIQIQFSDRTDDLVISQIQTGANGIREVTAYFYSGIGQSYTQVAVSNNIPAFSPLRNEGSTVFYLLDINLVQDGDPDNGLYVAARGTTQFWNRYALFGSRDGGANYGQLLSATGATTMGVVASALGNFTGSGVDSTNTISVVLESGSLISPTGLFLLGDEILSANTATLTAVNTYTLSNLVRGERGTEWAIANHGSNERFYLLGECDRLTGNLSDLNTAIMYKALTTGQALGDVSATTFTSTGKALKPYAPKSVSAYKPVDAIIINWIRRDRKDNSSVGTPRLNEYNERYEIDIFNGASVVRTLTATSPTVTYTQAQQVIDFGAGQTSIVIKVYQISETVGRGYAASYTSGILGTTSPIIYPAITPTPSSVASAAQATANNAVPQTRTITINGNTQDLSANRSWTISGGGGSGREILASDRTYYIRDDGNDSNNGLSDNSGGAFLTWAKCQGILASIDGNNYVVTVKFTGTFTNPIRIDAQFVGFSYIQLDGDVSTPSNAFINTSPDSVYIATNIFVYIKGLKLASSSGIGLFVANGVCRLNGNVEFGSCGFSHIYVSGGSSQLYQSANYIISGNAPTHIQLYDQGQFDANGSGHIVTLAGSRAFTQFILVGRGGMGLFVNITYSGSATGQQYAVLPLSGLFAINTAFPGNVAGTVDAKGYYGT